MGTFRGAWMAKHIFVMTMVFAFNFTRVAGTLMFSGSEPEKVLKVSSVVPEESGDLDNTVRVDPLDNLKKYRGGYDVVNKHYWSSTVFTGIYGYATAIIWLLCGLGYGIFLLVTCFSKRDRKKKKKRDSCHKQYHLQPLLFAISFTLLAVTACGLFFGGNFKFHSRAKTVIQVIINTANEASAKIHSTTAAMRNITSSLKEVGGTSKATDFLNSTSQKLDAQAADIETNASTKRKLIEKGLNSAYAITTAVISLTLIIVISLLAFGLLKFQRPLQVLIAFCWIFTFLCWLFFGVYFFLQNLAGDTCTALEGFQKDPYNNSLSSILPCEKLLSAKPVLNEVSAGIHNLVNKVNENISISYGNIVQICDPFSPPPANTYQPWNCPPHSVRIGDIPKVLRQMACPDTMGACNGGIIIPTSYYKTVEAYCFSIQTFLDAYPGVLSLIECQPVKDAFSEILQKHCKPLKRYLQLLWTALVFLSLALMALVLIWTIKAYHEQSHHSLGGSVKPHYAGIERGATKQTDDQPVYGPDQQIEIIGEIHTLSPLRNCNENVHTDI